MHNKNSRSKGAFSSCRSLPCHAQLWPLPTWERLAAAVPISRQESKPRGGGETVLLALLGVRTLSRSPKLESSFCIMGQLSSKMGRRKNKQINTFFLNKKEIKRATGPISESVNGGRSGTRLTMPRCLCHTGHGHARTAACASCLPAGRASPSGTSKARQGTRSSQFPETGCKHLLPLLPSDTSITIMPKKESASYISS